MLRDRAGANEQVLREPLNGLNQSGWHHQPAQAPTGHIEVFREAVDADDALAQAIGQGQCAVAKAFVKAQAQVDFVEDGHAATVSHGRGNALQGVAVDRGPCGVGWRGQQHATRGGAPGGGDVLGAELEALIGAAGQQHRLPTGGLHELAVAGVAGVGHEDFVALVDQRQTGQLQRGRSASGDDDARWVDGHTPSRGVPAADGFAQGRQAGGWGVLGQALFNGALRRSLHQGWCGEVGLADVQGDHRRIARACARLQLAGGFGQLHHVERSHPLSALRELHARVLA